VRSSVARHPVLPRGPLSRLLAVSAAGVRRHAIADLAGARHDVAMGSGPPVGTLHGDGDLVFAIAASKSEATW